MLHMIFDFGQLRTVRRAKKLHQADIAANIHCAPSTISNIETGRAKITAEMLALLCSIYGVDINTFFVKGMNEL